MSYADTNPVADHLQAPEVDTAGGIEEMIADQSLQVRAVDWIFERVTGESLIEKVIMPITGDWTRIAANGEAWRSVGDAVRAISDNLSANVDTLQQHWTGNASDSFGTHIRLVWFGGLQAEAGLATLIGEGFDAVAEMSQRLCQEALDLLERVVNKLIEAAATALIPIVGWGRAVKIVWDAYQIYQAIMGIIEAIRGIIEAAQQLFDAVGRIRNALEAIPDVRNANDAVAVAQELAGGVMDATEAARSVQDNVTSARDDFNQASETANSAAGGGVGGSTGGGGGGGGSW
jgi:methyl-accepting chemotaxis protein